MPWSLVPPPVSECGALGVPCRRLTKRDNYRASDAIRHHHAEDIQHPRIFSPKLEIHGLVLRQKAGVTLRLPSSLVLDASGTPLGSWLAAHS